MITNLKTVTVDLKAIDHNIKQLKKLLSPETKFMAVVKSNAYGHGLHEVAKQAVKSGANYLGVITASEAIKLRKWGILQPIVVLGVADKEEVKDLIKHKVAITVFNDESYRRVLKIATILNQKAIVHVKVDTGLNRLGFHNGDALKVIERMVSKPRVFNIEGLYTHFASTEELHQSYTKSQILAFERLLKKLSQQKIEIPIISMASSAATIMHPETHFTCVRVGIAMYGCWPSRHLEAWARRTLRSRIPRLKPALTYKAKLIHIHSIPAGQFVGYGNAFQAPKPMTIGVIPVGYYEGLPRSLSNMGFGLLKGGVLPVIGRVCMNMTILDLSKRPRAKVGDEVVLIGKNQHKEITATDVGDWAGTINYEILARLPEHLDRHFK